MERNGINFVVIAAVAILIGLSFWTLVGDTTGTLTKTFTSTNVSFTLPANQSTSDLIHCGQRNITSVTVWNYTNGTGSVLGAGGSVLLGASNFTVTQAAGSDGYLSARITCTALGTNYGCGYRTNVSCGYEPKGYISDGGARNIAALIPLFLAILIAFAAIPDLREWVGFTK